MKAREAHLEDATPVVVEAAQASSQDPWWKRIFARWSRGEEAAEILSEAGPEEALKEGLPSEGALPAVPSDQPGLVAAQEVAPTAEEDLEAAAPEPYRAAFQYADRFGVAQKIESQMRQFARHAPDFAFKQVIEFVAGSINPEELAI